jgi:hypothetical protein
MPAARATHSCLVGLFAGDQEARIVAFEKYSKPTRRRICVDFDLSGFSGLQGSDERDRTTAEWDWLTDAVAGSTSLGNWQSGPVP